MAKIKLGVRWPDYEVPIERGVVREFVQTVDGLGFDHVTIFDHLAGMTARTRRGWRSSYTTEMEWGESLTMLAHMTALSDRLGFMTAILGLPARPTLLVAKQAATIDRMAEGRFRLGVGLGWNDIEFAAMGTTFEDRPERMEEQIDVLRALFTKDDVLFRGKYHTLPSIGLSLAPVQRPIPIWMAAGRDAPMRVLRRVAKFADGVLPEWPPGDFAREMIERIRDEATKIGRDPSTIGLEPKISLRRGALHGIEQGAIRDDEELASQVKEWQEIGVTHIEFKTRSCGLTTIDDHLREVTRFKHIADAVLT